MILTSNENYICVAKEKIDYVDKKTGEIKTLYKLYLTNENTGIQEQILVNEKAFNTTNKDDKGKIQYEKTNYGCYYKCLNVIRK